MPAARSLGKRRAITPPSKPNETPLGLRRKNSGPASFSGEGSAATMRPTIALGLGMVNPPFGVQKDYISKDYISKVEPNSGNSVSCYGCQRSRRMRSAPPATMKKTARRGSNFAYGVSAKRRNLGINQARAQSRRIKTAAEIRTP